MQTARNIVIGKRSRGIEFGERLRGFDYQNRTPDISRRAAANSVVSMRTN